MKVPIEEITFTASRASGPGGQHVQKTSSRVTLRWNVLNSDSLTEEQKEIVLKKLAGRINKENELLINVETHRSQRRNKLIAYQLLNDLLTRALKKSKVRKRTKPSASSVERRLRQKGQLGEKKRQRRWSVDKGD